MAGMRCCLLALLLASWFGRDAEGDVEDWVIGRRRAPSERLTRAALAATHDDLVRIRQTRRDVPPLPGQTDYRAVFHAHAEDSSHTGGTRPEMLAEARRVGVRAVFLANHHRPPVDFMVDTWRGLRDGVLFVPGSEARGFLLHPSRSILAQMDGESSTLLRATRANGGLAFLSHVEERPGHAMDDLDGMEIYNRHADAKKDMAGLFALALQLTDPAALETLRANLRDYPDEILAAQVTYPADYLAKWDRETRKRRLTGVAANDCHHNQVLVLVMVDAETVRLGTIVDTDEQMRTVSAKLRPGIRALTRGHKPGDILARVDLDPYARSFLNACTHILAPTLDEPTLREAVREGHAYVSHDWMCDPTGFRFTMEAEGGSVVASMGDEIATRPGAALVARFPVPCRSRLIRDGKVVAEGNSTLVRHEVDAPGVYRVEAWLEMAGESRPWIYSNPIHARASARAGADGRP